MWSRRLCFCCRYSVECNTYDDQHMRSFSASCVTIMVCVFCVHNACCQQAGGKLERVAACTALCNLAFSPQYQHYNTVLVSNIVLEPLLQLLQGSCLPQQRSAARMLKALASGPQRVRPTWSLYHPQPQHCSQAGNDGGLAAVQWCRRCPCGPA